MTFIGGKFGDGFFGIPHHEPGILEDIPVSFLAYRILAGIEDRHPLLHNPPMIAHLIPGLGTRCLPSMSHRVITRMPSARSVESVGW